MGIKHELRRRLWRFGFDVSRFDAHSHPIARQRYLLAAHTIGVVLDVGASTGEWGQALRDEAGFAGLICSFEPTGAAFKDLKARAARDTNWRVFDHALGDVEGTQRINIAGNADSSSLLDMLPAHEAAAPESAFVGSEEIRVRTLDRVFEEVCPPGSRVFLKIDTQGYEGRVLAGARRSLPRIDVVQLEMSLVPLYEGQASLVELLEFMFAEGFELIGLDRGFTDARTGHVLQVDGIFNRPPSPVEEASRAIESEPIASLE